MKSLVHISTALILMLFLEISSQKVLSQQAGNSQGTVPLQAANVLTIHELVALVSEAHGVTVHSFSEAFQAELHDRTKPSWEEVRLQLLKYWSPGLVDGDLRLFYDAYLWDWGYEMGFAFPLWKPELIESIRIISQTPTEIVVDFRAPTNYETIENIRVKLILEDGSWLIHSQMHGDPV